MITDFAPLLEQYEIDILVSKLRLMRQRQGLETTNDEILLLVSWARAIRRNNVLLTLLMMSSNDDMLIDVKIDQFNVDKSTVNWVDLK